MSPTNKLRFVMRPTHALTGPFFIRVLQQWWEAEGWEHEVYVKAGGEWQDVPLETEEPK